MAYLIGGRTVSSSVPVLCWVQFNLPLDERLRYAMILVLVDILLVTSYLAASPSR